MMRLQRFDDGAVKTRFRLEQPGRPWGRRRQEPQPRSLVSQHPPREQVKLERRRKYLE